MALIASAVLLGACGPGAAASGASHRGRTHARPPLVAVAGGTATVALDQLPTTLNDHTVAGDTPSGRMLGSAVWGQVFRVGPGAVPQLDTNVVDSAEVVSVNPQTVMYQIDPRAVWSDGVAISVDDFVYAWQAQRGGAADVDGSPVSVASTLGYRDIASIAGSNGGRTVTVVFRQPFADWASLFADLLPAHVSARVGWNHGYDRFDPSVLVSGGPWMVASWQPGAQLVLTRNPRWWADAPRLERVVVRAVSGGASLASALGSGQVDVAYPSGFDMSFLAQASSSPLLESQTQLGTRMLQLAFNVRHVPLDVAAVREGVAHTIDRAAIATTVGQPALHSVWEDNHHLFANTQTWYADNAAGYERVDLPAAARLLEQGGLVADSRGTWTSHGRPIDLVVAWALDDPWSAATAPLVVAELVSAGFDVTAQPVPAGDLAASVLPSGSFDVALVPVDAGAYPSSLGSVYSTAPTVTGGVGTNWTGFDDPRVDTLFTQAAQELAAARAEALYQQIDQALWSDMPTLPLFAEPTFLVWPTWLTQVMDDPGGIGPFWNIRLWTRLAAPPSTAPAGSNNALGAHRAKR